MIINDENMYFDIYEVSLDKDPFVIIDGIVTKCEHIIPPVDLEKSRISTWPMFAQANDLFDANRTDTKKLLASDWDGDGDEPDGCFYNTNVKVYLFKSGKKYACEIHVVETVSPRSERERHIYYTTEEMEDVAKAISMFGDITALICTEYDSLHRRLMDEQYSDEKMAEWDAEAKKHEEEEQRQDQAWDNMADMLGDLDI